MNRLSTDSASKPVALFLAAEAPYPMAGGGAIRTASLLEYLAGSFSLDLIVFREPGAPHPADAIPPGLATRINVVDLPFHSKRPLARVLRNTSRLARNRPPLLDRFSGFESRIASILSGRNYDVAVLDHFWTAPYAAVLRDRSKRLVLDLHNVDSAWHDSMADSERGLPAFAFRRFARAALDFECHWLPQFDDILTTSPSDAALVRGIVPGIESPFIPTRSLTSLHRPALSASRSYSAAISNIPPTSKQSEFFTTKFGPPSNPAGPSCDGKF